MSVPLSLSHLLRDFINSFQSIYQQRLEGDLFVPIYDIELNRSFCRSCRDSVFVAVQIYVDGNIRGNPMVIYRQRRVFVDILKEEDGDDVRFNWVVGGGGGKEMV